MIQKQVRWRYACDEPGCLVSTITAEDELPVGWGAVFGRHFCHHHSEAHEFPDPAVRKPCKIEELGNPGRTKYCATHDVSFNMDTCPHAVVQLNSAGEPGTPRSQDSE